MMMLKPYLYLLLVVLISCKEGVKNPLPKEAEYYTFINTQFPCESPNFTYVLDEARYSSIDSSYLMDVFNYFQILISEKDECYIMEQFNDTSRYLWDENKFINRKLISQKQVDSIVKSDQSKWFSYVIYSKPIFNYSGSICIAEEYHECGYFCGGGEFSVYLKYNGNWKKIHGGHSVE